MANVLSEQKRQQVVALGRLNWSLRQIQEAVGVRRETASAYLKAAGIAIRTVRGRRPPPKPASRAITDPEADSKPASQAITDLSAPPPPAPKSQPSRCEPYRQIVEQAVSSRRNGVAIYQELVDTHGFGGSYSSVRRFVRTLREHGVAKTFAVIHTEPGEEAQVDYGTGPMVRHPESGTYRRTRLFVLTLGFSRKCVRFLVWRSSSRTWADLHEQAFRRLGGCTRVMVLDNLKEGVLRIRNPDRKGKVERGVGHAQETPLKGLSFESLEEAQAHLDHWEERWADTRIHGTTKRQVAAMFAEEKPHLRPLPLEPFRSYEYGTRTVHLDGHVEVARAYYSVPPGHVGRVVWVQWDSRQVRILSGQHGQLLREHARQQPGRHRTAREDRPAPTPQRLHDILGRARRAGEHIGTLCRLIHEREGDLGSRRILGVIALVKRFGAQSVEDACAAALEIGTPTYRFVRRYVERQPSLRLTLKQIDPLIRELTDYRDLIDRITNHPPQEEP